MFRRPNIRKSVYENAAHFHSLSTIPCSSLSTIPCSSLSTIPCSSLSTIPCSSPCSSLTGDHRTLQPHTKPMFQPASFIPCSRLSEGIHCSSHLECHPGLQPSSMHSLLKPPSMSFQFQPSTSHILDSSSPSHVLIFQQATPFSSTQYATPNFHQATTRDDSIYCHL